MAIRPNDVLDAPPPLTTLTNGQAAARPSTSPPRAADSAQGNGAANGNGASTVNGASAVNGTATRNGHAVNSVPVSAAAPEATWKEQFAEIATLAGGLAHEVRNPLSSIKLNLELLQEELDGDDCSPRDRRNRQRVQKVLHECSRLDQLLNDFLQFARAHAPQCESTSLNDEVREFLDFLAPLANDSRVEVRPHLAAQLPLVALDRRQFWQVLQNLCRNALQAMPNGGCLELLTYADAGMVVLEIIDNGAGMDEKTQSRMFDTFFSTKPGGSGLGLPTVKRILEAHGGTITCESALGAGTRFRLQLPAL